MRIRLHSRLAFYVTLRYITVSGRRVRGSRCNGAVGPRRAVQWWHVARPAYHRHDEIKRCVQRHTPLTIAKAARRVVAVTRLRADALSEHTASEKKAALVTTDDPRVSHANSSPIPAIITFTCEFRRFRVSIDIWILSSILRVWS